MIYNEQSEIIDECGFEKAEDFLDYLRPSREHWRASGDLACRWIFRGHADAEWDLLPSAWRGREQDEANLLYEPYMRWRNRNCGYRLNILSAESKKIPEYNERCQHICALRKAEYSVVVAFSELLNEIGERIPGEWPIREYRNIGLKPDPLTGEEPDSHAKHEAFALAQHHKVPTRLLDWTANPLVAAFFAAADKENAGDHLTVWAFNPSLVILDELTIVTPQKSAIGFLRAQQGVFTHFDDADMYYIRTGHWPRLNRGHGIRECLSSRPIRKIVLPSTEASKLLNLLWLERVSLAHLMPTHDNVTRTLEIVGKQLVRVATHRHEDAAE